jgi:hypothetical protein
VSGRHPSVALVSGLAGVLLFATKNGRRLLHTHMRYVLVGKHARVRVRARMRAHWQAHRLVAWFALVGARGSIVRLDWRVGRAATASACWAELAPRRSVTSHHHPPPTSPATRPRRLNYLNYPTAGRVIAIRAAAPAAEARRPRPRRRLGRAQACGEPSDAQRRPRKAVAASRSRARAAMAEAARAWRGVERGHGAVAVDAVAAVAQARECCRPRLGRIGAIERGRGGRQQPRRLRLRGASGWRRGQAAPLTRARDA